MSYTKDLHTIIFIKLNFTISRRFKKKIFLQRIRIYKVVFTFLTVPVLQLFTLLPNLKEFTVSP